MNLLRFVGIFARSTRFGGFIIITLFIIVSSFAQAISTNGQDSPETITSVFSPIICLIKFVINSTYK